MNATYHLLVVMLVAAGLSPALAGEVSIELATLEARDDGWDVSVTLRHADTGWDHYADQWRVVNAAGEVLGRRVLHHPHVEEQPFTRRQSGIAIPSGTTVIYIEAHDTVHGWSTDRLEVDLGQPEGPRHRIAGN
jgi:hypothetical protein